MQWVYVFFHAVDMVFIHPNVIQTWKESNLEELLKYISLQLKGLRTCLTACSEAVHLTQTEHSLHVLKRFLRKCFEVLHKYANVCLRQFTNYNLDDEESVRKQIELYLGAISHLVSTIFESMPKLMAKKKMYILVRIFAKSRLTLEKYLVHVDYWMRKGML